jgi:hypothetical protein
MDETGAISMHNAVSIPSDYPMPLLTVDITLQGESLTLTRVTGVRACDQLVIECRMGAVPPGHEARLYERLLHLNFQFCTLQGSGFSIHPDTAEVTCAETHDLDTANAERLYARAVRLAAAVRKWRPFLFGEEAR